MKLMRGYRFRREAFTMLRAFLLVFRAFAIEAFLDWVRGRGLGKPVTALAVSAVLFLLLVAALFALDALIRAYERKHGAHYPAPRATEP